MAHLVRFVTMRFEAEKVPNFLQLFEEVQPKIAARQGCHHVSVHKDEMEPDTYYTISEWDNAEALNAYRYSELFTATWARTKPLFRAKPSAMSWQLT